jgi:hypothetical protein
VIRKADRILTSTFAARMNSFTLDTSPARSWVHQCERALQDAPAPERPRMLDQFRSSLAAVADHELITEIRRVPRNTDPRLVTILASEWAHRRMRDPARFRDADLDAVVYRLLASAPKGSRSPEAHCQLLAFLGHALLYSQWTLRSDNVEQAVTAFRAALDGNRLEGVQRLQVLVHLVEALRLWRGGSREANLAEGDHLLGKAEELSLSVGSEGLAVSVLVERVLRPANAGDFARALEILDGHAITTTATQSAARIKDLRAEVLRHWADKDPSRKEAAVIAGRDALDALTTSGLGHPGAARARLRALGESLPPPSVADICAGPLHEWADDLGDDALSRKHLNALDSRIRKEEIAAFSRPFGSGLVRGEAQLAPLILRLAREALRAGNEVLAFNHLARLGSWRLRRALSWRDAARVNPLARELCRWRAVEEELARARVTFQVGDYPTNQSALEIFPGEDRSIAATRAEVGRLRVLEPTARAEAAIELELRIESRIDTLLRQLSETSPALHARLLASPLPPVGGIAELVHLGEGRFVLVAAHLRMACGIAWRRRNGTLGARAVFFDTEVQEVEHDRHVMKVKPSAGIDQDLRRAAREAEEDGAERVTTVARGGARSMNYVGQDARTRAVHIPGIDRPSKILRTPPSRPPALVLLEIPDRPTPFLLVVARTLERLGFKVHRPGARITPPVAAEIEGASGVAIGGHGRGQSDPRGPSVAGQPVSEFERLELGSAEWTLCLSCAAGDPIRDEDLAWDRDDATGAGEFLLLAGASAALDCLEPVPEFLAAVLLEELGARALRGEEPERAFHTTVLEWRAFLGGLAASASMDKNGGSPIPGRPREFAAWFGERLDEERRRRLGPTLDPFPHDALLGRFLGEEAKPTSWAGRLLERSASPDLWAALRWLSRA